MRRAHELTLDQVLETLTLLILLISVSYRTIIPEPIVMSVNVLGFLFALRIRKFDNYFIIIFLMMFYIFFKNTWLVSDSSVVLEGVRIFAISIPYALMIKTSRNRAKLLRRFIIFSLPVPIIGIAGLLNINIPFIDVSSYVYSRSGGEYTRAASIFGNPNYYGAFVYFCLAMWVSTSFHVNGRGKPENAAIMIIFLVGGLLSLSRSFQGAILLLLPALTKVGTTSKSGNTRVFFFLSTISILALLFNYLLSGNFSANDLVSRWVNDGGGQGTRLDGIQYGLEIIDRSFFGALFGNGANAMMSNSDVHFQAHNSLIRIWVEYGTIYLFLFVGFVALSLLSFRGNRLGGGGTNGPCFFQRYCLFQQMIFSC